MVSIDDSYISTWEQEGLEVLGKAYRVSAAGNITSLNLPAVVSINFTGDGLSREDLSNLSLYHWDPPTSHWLKFNSEVGKKVYFVSANVDQLGHVCHPEGKY